MFADDFLFNNQRLSDFNMIIGGMDSDGEAVVSGGEIEIQSVRPPDKDVYDYYTSTLDSPVQYNFAIMKADCSNPDDMYVSPEEESRLAKWLLSKGKENGYEWLQFDQDYYRDICYKVKFTTMQPIQVCGRTIGFELSCMSNCGYGFTNEKKHYFTLVDGTDVTIVVTNDMLTYLYPQIKITGGSGEFTFGNVSDTQQTYSHFNNIAHDIVMDCDNDLITGISKPTDFNWYFPRLVDGNNVFTTNSSNTLTVEMTYREARRILV